MKTTLKKTLSIILAILMVVTTAPFAFAEGDGVPLTIDVTGASSTVYINSTNYDEDGVILTGSMSYDVVSQKASNLTLKDITAAKLRYNIYTEGLVSNIAFEGYNEFTSYIELYKDHLVFEGSDDSTLKAAYFYNGGNSDSTVTLNGGNMILGGGETQHTVRCGKFIINDGTVTATHDYNNYVICSPVELNGGTLNVISTAANGEAIAYDITMKKGALLTVSTEYKIFDSYDGADIVMADDASENDSFFVRYDTTSEFVPVYDIQAALDGKTYAEIKVDTHEHSRNEEGKCDTCGAPCYHNNITDGKCSVCGADCPHKNIVDSKCSDCGAELKLAAITMNDSYGDGWNGNAVVIEQLVNGDYAEYATATFESGKEAVYSAILSPDGTYVFKWKQGQYTNECSFTVAVDGETVYECTDGSTLTDGQVLYEIINHTCDFENAEWKTDGEKHWKECADASCDKTAEEAPHSFDENYACVCGKKESFTITLVDTGDVYYPPITQEYGSDVAPISDPTKTGYIFAGWDKDFPGTMPAGGMTLTALWTKCEHTGVNINNGVCDECNCVMSFSLTVGETVTYHETFEEAYEKAEEGSTIKLLKTYTGSVPDCFDKPFTFDLAGNRWVFEGASIRDKFCVKADVTFADSVGGGYFDYDIYLQTEESTFEGGSYYSIGLDGVDGVTLMDYLAPCRAYYDKNGEEKDYTSALYTDFNVSIKAGNHDWLNKDGVCAICKDECLHKNYTDGVCDMCGIACPHDEFTDSVDGLTPVYHSSSGGIGAETADKLFDGDSDTKWCSNFEGDVYLIFSYNNEVKINSYTLTPANDTVSYPKRNWVSWTLYGGNSANGEWTPIHTVTDANIPENEESEPFTVTSDAYYRYYKIAVTANGGAGEYDNTQQMAEISIDAEAIDAEVKYLQCKECGYVCTHATYTDGVCDVCDYECSHNGLVYEITEEAECGKNAVEEATCTLCTKVFEREVENSALTHSFTKYEVTEEAKCGVVGKEVAYCDNNCGETDEKAIDALEHDIVIDEAVAPECGKTGLTQGEHCSRCDYKVEQKVVDALDHKDDDGDYECDYNCGYEYEKPTDPTPDTPDEPDEPDTPDEPTDDACDHLCHSDNWFIKNIIWKIVKFFWKLFKMNPVCECGAAHY